MPRNFKAMLAEYDKQIGRLLDGMKQLGLDKNTIVIFTSDNGSMPYTMKNNVPMDCGV